MLELGLGETEKGLFVAAQCVVIVPVPVVPLGEIEREARDEGVVAGSVELAPVTDFAATGWRVVGFDVEQGEFVALVGILGLFD